MANNPPVNSEVRDAGLISGSGRSPGGGHGNPLQYSCLENPMDRGAWLKEGMATHSSILAWRIPWTEEPGKLRSTGLQRVGHD